MASLVLDIGRDETQKSGDKLNHILSLDIGLYAHFRLHAAANQSSSCIVFPNALSERRLLHPLYRCFS